MSLEFGCVLRWIFVNFLEAREAIIDYGGTQLSLDVYGLAARGHSIVDFDKT